MPDTTKPNLILPVALWGEVKVAAFRRGCKPVELVIECLSKAFPVGGAVERKQVKVTSRVASGPVSLPAASAFQGVICASCGGDVGTSYVYNREKKPVCQSCAKKEAGVK